MYLIYNIVINSWLIVWNFRMVVNDVFSFILSMYDKVVISSNFRLIEEKVFSCVFENDLF